LNLGRKFLRTASWVGERKIYAIEYGREEMEKF
jgi:hypothetical protein